MSVGSHRKGLPSKSPTLNASPHPSQRDLATALTAFTALKRLAKVDLLGEFLEEVRVFY